MKTLQEQIAEFKAKGCVAGGRKWEVLNGLWDTVYIRHKFHQYIIRISETNTNPSVLLIDVQAGEDTNIYSATANSTTLEEALIEALDIVKAKVMELAKELGIFCLTTEEHQIAVDNLKIAFDRNWKNDEEHMKTAHHIQDAYFMLIGRYQEKMNNLQEFKQYIEEQGNDK